MAEMTIQLRIDPVSGKKDIVVSLSSDEDSLPHEHEQRHRELVDALIESGVLKASEAGKVVVERVSEDQESTAVSAPAPTERESQSEGS